MTTYSRVATRGGAIQKHHQARVEDNSNGDDAVRKKWWWEVVPVDSCCCCFSLRAGVGLLATYDFLSGLWITFFMHEFFISNLERLLLEIQSQYAQRCSGSPVTASCDELEERMEQAEANISVFLHLQIIVYVQGALAILAGVVGLLAVFQKRSTLPVRVYMLSWPTKFFLGVWGTVRWHSLKNKFGVQEQDSDGIFWVISTCFHIYYFKVSWSYYKNKLAHQERAHGDRVIRNVSLNAVSEEEPMITINATV